MLLIGLWTTRHLCSLHEREKSLSSRGCSVLTGHNFTSLSGRTLSWPCAILGICDQDAYVRAVTAFLYHQNTLGGCAYWDIRYSTMEKYQKCWVTLKTTPTNHFTLCWLHYFVFHQLLLQVRHQVASHWSPGSNTAWNKSAEKLCLEFLFLIGSFRCYCWRV